MFAAPAFIRDHRGVEHGAKHLRRTILRPEELLAGTVNLDRQGDRAVWQWHGVCEGQSLGRIADARYDAGTATDLGFMRDQGCMKFMAVIVGSQPRRALPVWRIGQNIGLGVVRLIFLPAGNEGLLNQLPRLSRPIRRSARPVI